MKVSFRIVWFILVFGSVVNRAVGATADPSPEPSSRDAEYRRLVIGTWQDHYRGTRTMTVQTNGTARMVVELGGLTALLYASRLEFDMVWSIENGHLKKRTTGGKPPGKVKTILRMMGDYVDEPIIELTKDRLLLLDGNGKTRYDWRRLPKPPP